MSEMVAAPADALMHARYHPATPLLIVPYHPLLSREEARVLDLLARWGNGKHLDAHINPHRLPNGRQRDGSHSLEKETNQFPVVARRIVAVLGLPSRGRCKSTLTRPSLETTRRFSPASSAQPTGTWGKVRLS